MDDAGATADPVQLIHEISPAALALVRIEDGRLLTANPACRRLLGITDQDLRDGYKLEAIQYSTGRAPSESLHLDGSVSEIEITIEHPELGPRLTIAALVPIEIDGRLCVVATLFDITGRQQLRRELEESQTRMNAFMDRAPAVILLKDVEGHYLWGNRVATVDYGITETSEPTTVFETMPHAVAEQMTALDRRAIDEGDVVREEMAVPSVSGDIRHLDVVKFPLLDNDGVVYAVGTIASDVTDQRRAIHALRDSEERFRQLAESVDEVFVLWVTDPIEVLHVTPSVHRVLGIPVADYSTAAFFSVVHPDDRPALAEGMVTASPSDPPRMREFRVIRPDGEQRWIRSRMVPIPSTHDGRTRWSSTFTDITDEVTADQALASALADAEQANRAKSEFLSRMSHELRTPLNAVLGFGQLLQADGLDGSRRMYVDQILNAGRHLLGLVDEVLDIARIESGFLRLSIEPVAIDELLHEAIDLVRPSAISAGLTIRIESTPADVHVRADRLRLRQVLLNLLSNAIKYNSVGGEIVVASESTSPRTIRVSIADDGPGIGPTGMSKLFEPFERLEADATAVQGTGLGLALARELMELMGGSIGVESTLGVGSRFWIDLVEIEAQLSLLPAEVAAAANVNGDASRQRKSTVLIIEDNPSNILLVEQILSNRPRATLVTATTGRQGLEALRSNQVDLVLLDLHLPDMRGEEILREVHADAQLSSVPVVVITADATEGHRDSIVALGAVDHLTKPFDIARFLSIVDRYCSRAQRGRRVLQAEDDQLNRTFMARLFDRDLPDVELVSTRTGEETLSAIRNDEPDLLLLDLHLPDMLGTSLLETMDDEGLMRDRPKLILSGDLRPRGWVDSPNLRFMTKPFDIVELVDVVKSMLEL